MTHRKHWLIFKQKNKHNTPFLSILEDRWIREEGWKMSSYTHGSVILTKFRREQKH